MHGEGIINEINHYAAIHGKQLSPRRAFLIYLKLAALHGRNIIKLNGNGPSEYLIGKGDWGLSHPGTGHWYPGVEADLDKLLNSNFAS